MAAKVISPARRRAWHNLAIAAEARVRGQDILFKGPVKYDFPRPLMENELPQLRSYIAQHTKLSLQYDVSSRGVVQTYDEPTAPRLVEQESVAAYTMQAWDMKSDTGRLGIYFKPSSDESRLEAMRFRGIEFTPDTTGAMSPSRDEELRHRLLLTFVGYFNKDNVNSSAFPNMARDDYSATANAAG